MAIYKTSLRRRTFTVDDMKEAELEIIQYATARERNSKRKSTLQKGEPVNRNSHIYKLNPVLQDGIIRVGGRLSRAAIPEESKHPAILAKDLRVSELILQEVHKKVGHSGRNHVLSKLRLKYWIPSASATIRRVLSKCLVCRRLHGVAGQQQMADLPRNRVLPDEPPFTRTRVDYFGPFEVKRGRATMKKYGVIFTCLAIQAVHLEEVAASQDKDSFIKALRRFIARRGQVMDLRSDNGTNFIGAERELKKAIHEWNTSKIEDTLRQRGIEWMFNPSTASHYGGVWERLIRSIRKILNASLKTQSLDEESLQTFLCEAGAIINSRQITTPSSDPNDLEALTPNHLLLLRTKPSLPSGLIQKEDLYARRSWRQVQYMADLFWKRMREYLPELQIRQKWSRVSQNFVPGDIVLLEDETAPINSWVMGKVIQSVPDENGLVRRVRVKTKTSELDRPITKVCLVLESV
ncbi:hypothetical protein N1851_028839 [Merluccius polli]|uniref:Integrase catalytic domain-containing protein n=1 Tax=Merluccius polli TaxID=89951 RepID=A0AA47NS72_MERPO|nr:hypothetical protein N1851_028839 [Merluccius polli]